LGLVLSSFSRRKYWETPKSNTMYNTILMFQEVETSKLKMHDKVKG
jgi:hypothetical protein